MTMRGWVGKSALLAGVLAVTGCQGLATIATDYSPQSLKPTDELRLLLVQSGTQPSGEGKLETGLLSAATLTALKDHCGVVPPPPPRPQPGPKVMPVLVAGAIVAGAGIVIDAVTKKIGEHIEEKQKEFISEYDWRVNVPDLYLPSTGTPLQRCLVLQRTVEMTVKDLNIPAHKELVRDMKPEDKIKLPALTMGFKFEKTGTAYALRPIFVDLNYSEARANEKSPHVTFGVGIAISVVQQGPYRAVSRLHAQQSFTLAKLPLPDIQTVEKDKPAQDVRTAIDVSRKLPGIVMAPLDRPVPATIAVSIVETGKGASDAKTARAEFDAVASALKSIGVDGLKSLLGGE